MRGLREQEKSRGRIGGEAEQGLVVSAEQRLDLGSGAVAQPEIDHLGRGAAEETQVMEIVVLRYDHEIMPGGVAPDFVVRAPEQTDLTHVAAVGKEVGEMAGETRR